MSRSAAVRHLAPFCLLLLPAVAQAQVVYTQDFQGAVGPEWSSAITDTAPANPARRFLGQFGNNTVTLSLSSLPVHSALTLSLEFFAIRTWDGNVVVNSTGNTVGPDVWEIRSDGSTVLRTTFSNWANGESPNDPTVPQSYPGSFPGGNFEGRTGADENNTLGFNNAAVIQDSVYQLDFTFAHTSSSVTLSFAGIGLQAINDESWGIDNVVVVASAAPEPGSLALLAMTGLPIVGAIRRRRAWQYPDKSCRKQGSGRHFVL